MPILADLNQIPQKPMFEIMKKMSILPLVRLRRTCKRMEYLAETNKEKLANRNFQNFDRSGRPYAESDAVNYNTIQIANLPTIRTRSVCKRMQQLEKTNRTDRIYHLPERNLQLMKEAGRIYVKSYTVAVCFEFSDEMNVEIQWPRGILKKIRFKMTLTENNVKELQEKLSQVPISVIHIQTNVITNSERFLRSIMSLKNLALECSTLRIWNVQGNLVGNILEVFGVRNQLFIGNEWKIMENLGDIQLEKPIYGNFGNYDNFQRKHFAIATKCFRLRIQWASVEMALEFIDYLIQIDCGKLDRVWIDDMSGYNPNTQISFPNETVLWDSDSIDSFIPLRIRLQRIRYTFHLIEMATKNMIILRSKNNFYINFIDKSEEKLVDLYYEIGFLRNPLNREAFLNADAAGRQKIIVKENSERFDLKLQDFYYDVNNMGMLLAKPS